jgi:hypothetical protein
MAATTILSKKPGMNGRFVVAGSTFTYWLNKKLVGVAVLAGQRSMRSFQGKDLGVVKVSHRITAVVAAQTVRTK